MNICMFFVCSQKFGIYKSDKIMVAKDCEADTMRENSRLVFPVGVNPVPLCHFKLAYVVLHMAVKEFCNPPPKIQK